MKEFNNLKRDIMNNILWYQPAKLSDKDVVIKNGNILDEGTERLEAFQNLKKISEKAIGKERPWHGKIGNYYFIKGNFEEKDERGRHLSFLFISDAPNGKEALINTLKAINQEVNEKTESCLSSQKSSVFNAILLSFIGLVILGFIIYLVKLIN